MKLLLLLLLCAGCSTMPSYTKNSHSQCDAIYAAGTFKYLVCYSTNNPFEGLPLKSGTIVVAAEGEPLYVDTYEGDYLGQHTTTWEGKWINGPFLK